MASRKSLQQDPVRLLAGVPLFAGIGQALLTRLGAHCALSELSSHTPVYRAGEPVRNAHFLIRGSIKRCNQLTDDMEQVLELVRPGQMFALSETFGAQIYRSLATTLEPSTVICVPIDVLLDAAGKYPALWLRLLETIARQQFAAEFEHVSHHALSGAQRVLDYLLRLAGDRRGIAGETTVCLDASKKLIAARLDMTPETFSRTLRQLTIDGVIVVNGRSIHIQNATLALDGVKIAKDNTIKLRYPRVDRKPEEFLSAAALVNMCGRHRMLSQRMAAVWGSAACSLNIDTSQIALRKLRNQFERNLSQVSKLPLSPTLRKHVDALQDRWAGYRDLLTTSPPNPSDAEKAFRQSEQILACADRLTAAAASQANTPAAKFVNVSGRNRMLTARLTKLFFFLSMRIDEKKALMLMDESRTEFHTNMEKLRNHVTDTPEIMAQLAIDTEHWQVFLSVIDAAMDAPTNLKQARKVLEACDELLRHVDTTVKLYEKLGEREHSPNQPATRPGRR